MNVLISYKHKVPIGYNTEQFFVSSRKQYTKPANQKFEAIKPEILVVAISEGCNMSNQSCKTKRM